ncbi:MAG: hypothetical protein ABIL05_02440 [candidate division WOR-3 bacterium]
MVTWNKNLIIREIKRLKRKHPDFSPAYVFHHHRALYQAAIRHFGSWRRALRTIDLHRGLKRERHWSKEKVIAEIRKYARRKVSLNYKNIARRTRRLIQAATRYFGSWGKAVTRAGFNYKKIKERYRSTA